MIEQIDALNQQIRNGSPGALDMLATLASPCVADADGQSPFNVAIEVGNAPVIEVLLRNEDAIEYAPELLTKDQEKKLRKVYEFESHKGFEEAEPQSARIAGTLNYWQRTPLLQACRYQNGDAVRQLIARGAKLTAKDLLRNSPLDLCIATGGIEFAQVFINACISTGVKFPINEATLSVLCRSRALFDLAVEHGHPDARAKALMFNFHCAYLDRPGVEAMLGTGFDVNKAVNPHSSPVHEVLTSQLTWMHQAEGWETLAAAYANAKGYPGANAIHVPEGESFNKVVLRNKKLNQSVRRSEGNPKFMTNDERATRLGLLSLLLQSGIDVKKLEAKLITPLVADALTSNEPAFLLALAEAGFDLAATGQFDNIGLAIQHGCFDVIPILEQHGNKLRNTGNCPADRVKQHREWRSARSTANPADDHDPE